MRASRSPKPMPSRFASGAYDARRSTGSVQPVLSELQRKAPRPFQLRIVCVSCVAIYHRSLCLEHQLGFCYDSHPFIRISYALREDIMWKAWIAIVSFASVLTAQQTQKVWTIQELFTRNVGSTEQQNKQFPPHKIIGNVYYVGTESLSSFLITTPQGHILI